ncbi:hypothetical protein LCGC14_2990210, partial [marine sediment metagenome]
MARVKVNLKGVSAEDFTPIPEGWYMTSVDKLTLGQSKAKKPKLDVRFNIRHDVNEDTEYAKRKLFITASLQKQALFTLKRFLLASEVYEEGELDKRLDFDTDDLLGVDLWCLVKNEEYNSKMQNRIARFAPA